MKLTALCDVDKKVLEAGAAKHKVAGYQDIRVMLEKEELDVVTVATPNHWHSLAAIWAVQAGKDVYVEKPVSHNVWEGRQLVNAARKYKRLSKPAHKLAAPSAFRMPCNGCRLATSARSRFPEASATSAAAASVISRIPRMCRARWITISGSARPPRNPHPRTPALRLALDVGLR